jgi:hypothetical protein
LALSAVTLHALPAVLAETLSYVDDTRDYSTWSFCSLVVLSHQFFSSSPPFQNVSTIAAWKTV